MVIVFVFYPFENNSNKQEPVHVPNLVFKLVDFAVTDYLMTGFNF